MTAEATEVARRLSDIEPEGRRQAAAMLGEMDADVAIPLLQVALGDADWRVRKEGVTVCLQLLSSPELLDMLVDALAPRDNVGLRNAAVVALGGHFESATDRIAVQLDTFDTDSKKLAAGGSWRNRCECSAGAAGKIGE